MIKTSFVGAITVNEKEEVDYLLQSISPINATQESLGMKCTLANLVCRIHIEEEFDRFFFSQS